MQLSVGEKVKTPYGAGVVKSIRTGGDGSNAATAAATVVIIEPSTWSLDRGQKPVFYMNPKDVTSIPPKFATGDFVTTFCGKGKVHGYRSADSMYIVKLENWFLADSKSPTLYLNEDSLKRWVPSQEEKKKSFREDALKLSEDLKLKANDLFKQKKFEEAKATYYEALQKLKYVEIGDEQMENDLRAKCLEKYIPITNNLANCCLKLKHYKESKTYADNVKMTLDSLEEQDRKKKCEKLMIELQKLGLTRSKLFKDYICKSLYYFGQAAYHLGEYDSAIKNLERNIAVRSNSKFDEGEVGDQSPSQDFKDINTLIEKCKERIAAEKVKEKALWANAFKKNSEVSDDKTSSSSTSSSPSISPITPTSPPRDKKGSSKGTKKSSKDKGKKLSEEEEEENQISTWSFSNPWIVIGGILSFAGIFAFSFYRQIKFPFKR